MCDDIVYSNQGMIRAPGGYVWFGIYGEGPKAPLVAVHGGPGAPHDYLIPFMKELADQDSRPVVFYDQLGCGRSQRPRDTALWTVERYRDELLTVIDVLGLGSFHLWGHSWGTQLALNSAATRPRPPALLTLTLASPIINIPAYRSDLRELLVRQPRWVQDGIAQNPPESEAYQKALSAFYAEHLHALDPLPECWRDSFAQPQFGREPYQTMIGADELNYTGNLTHRDDSKLLLEVDAPVWLACGRKDVATPARCREHHERTPGSAMTVFENSSHAFFDEERPACLEATRDFLGRHEKN